MPPVLDAYERSYAVVIARVLSVQVYKGIDFVITRLAEMITVSGILRFSDGKPAAEELVNFAAVARDGFDGNVTETTDADGRFTLKILKGLKGEIYGIDEGSYVLVVNADGANSQNKYLRLFYPGVTERKKATLIHISAGEFIRDVNLVLKHRH